MPARWLAFAPHSGAGNSDLRDVPPAYTRGESQSPAAHTPAPLVPTLATLLEEGTGMITGFEGICLSVRDQDEALDFYVNKLGFEKRLDIQVIRNFAG
jgi:hypothetical protein